jgi:hypothetical protein
MNHHANLSEETLHTIVKDSAKSELLPLVVLEVVEAFRRRLVLQLGFG